ncbi:MULTISPECIES: trimeric intracellular cation channel family protein [Aequorivita]|uniref:Trimeric intracellular cation channel family protein n=2 Tax=Aequorivita TaxID=153265 RepID=A0AB35YM44_9FLAO|nr:trimeric intracellular cation channel family protein [Aequorivita sp. Ant34-E75]WGF91770.1 trimeric intracellular cation channel family protein [Aequorivita sp. Ant34-E75]
MKLILLIDILGTIAFAISGVLTAINKRLDPFGILIIAFVAAIGGGTLRDILIGANVAWMRDLTYVYVIFGSTIFTVVFRKRLEYIRRSLLLFDTIGITFYTIVGVEKGIAAGFEPIICIALGTITACFGGVIRDILCNEIPIIFRKEIYATACILGASAYFLLLNTTIPLDFIVIISGSVIFIVRLLAVYFNLSLPTIYRKDELE